MESGKIRKDQSAQPTVTWTSACGQRLKSLRGARPLSQQGLAERAGIDVKTIYLLEAGKTRNPTIAILYALAGALGCDLAELTGEKAPPWVRAATRFSQVAALSGDLFVEPDGIAWEGLGTHRAVLIVGPPLIGKSFFAVTMAAREATPGQRYLFEHPHEGLAPLRELADSSKPAVVVLDDAFGIESLNLAGVDLLRIIDQGDPNHSWILTSRPEPLALARRSSPQIFERLPVIELRGSAYPRRLRRRVLERHLRHLQSQGRLSANAGRLINEVADRLVRLVSLPGEIKYLLGTLASAPPTVARDVLRLAQGSGRLERLAEAWLASLPVPVRLLAETIAIFECLPCSALASFYRAALAIWEEKHPGLDAQPIDETLPFLSWVVAAPGVRFEHYQMGSAIRTALRRRHDGDVMLLLPLLQATVRLVGFAEAAYLRESVLHSIATIGQRNVDMVSEVLVELLSGWGASESFAPDQVPEESHGQYFRTGAVHGYWIGVVAALLEIAGESERHRDDVLSLLICGTTTAHREAAELPCAWMGYDAESGHGGDVVALAAIWEFADSRKYSFTPTKGCIAIVLANFGSKLAREERPLEMHFLRTNAPAPPMIVPTVRDGRGQIVALYGPRAILTNDDGNERLDNRAPPRVIWGCIGMNDAGETDARVFPLTLRATDEQVAEETIDALVADAIALQEAQDQLLVGMSKRQKRR